jgi:hypothetical protein
VFAWQASSAESERAFSTAGRLKSATRSQLSPKIVAALVVMKANADLLGKGVNGLDSENDLDSDIDFIDR